MKITPLVLSLLLLCPVAARADVLPDDSKGVRWEGVLEVPEPLEGVRFVLYPSGFGSYSQPVTPGEPFHATKFPSRIYAVRETPPSGDQREEERAFFARPELPRSEQLEARNFVPNDDPRARIEVRYRLEGIEGSVVRLSWVERSWDAQGNPLPERRGGYQPPAVEPAPKSDQPGPDLPGPAQPAQPTPPAGSAGGWCALQPSRRDGSLVGLSLVALALLLGLARRGARA